MIRAMRMCDAFLKCTERLCRLERILLFEGLFGRAGERK